MADNLSTMDKILSASFGEPSSSIRATFKKTINIKQYETEVVELSTTLEMDKPLTGVERALVSAMLQAQLEYQAYIQLWAKGSVTDEQLVERRKFLEENVIMLMQKGESLLGKSMSYLFELTNQG